MIEGRWQRTRLLVAARGFLHRPSFRASAVAMAVTVAIAMPALDEFRIDLFGAVETLAVIAIIREWHELLELLAEADARRPLIEMEDVVDGPLRLDVDEFVVTA